MKGTLSCAENASVQNYWEMYATKASVLVLATVTKFAKSPQLLELRSAHVQLFGWTFVPNVPGYPISLQSTGSVEQQRELDNKMQVEKAPRLSKNLERRPRPPQWLAGTWTEDQHRSQCLSRGRFTCSGGQKAVELEKQSAATEFTTVKRQAARPAAVHYFSIEKSSRQPTPAGVNASQWRARQLIEDMTVLTDSSQTALRHNCSSCLCCSNQKPASQKVDTRLRQRGLEAPQLLSNHWAGNEMCMKWNEAVRCRGWVNDERRTGDRTTTRCH